MSVNYIQVQRFSFAYTIYNMRHNLMCPLSTRNTIQRGGLSGFNQVSTIMMSGILVALVLPMVIMPMFGVKYKKSISNYGQSYGEWAEPTEVHITGFKDFASPHPEETTAYIVYMLQTMAEIAEVLGKTTYKIVIPANTTAKVILPGGEKTLTAGKYEFAEE